MRQPACRSMTPLGAGSLRVSHSMWKGTRQGEPWAERDTTERKRVERRSEVWESQRMAKRKV